MTDPRVRRPRAWLRRRGVVALALLMLLGAHSTAAVGAASAQVVAIVDTSTSMNEPDMDPHNVTQLVAGLLADVVPGEFAAVRLLDVRADARLLPSRRTGETTACHEDPGRRCERVEPRGDWEQEARRGRYGVLERGRRADPGFHRKLVDHLARTAGNSLYSLAFRGAQGVFDRLGAGPPRTVLWLSDGRDERPEAVRAAIADLRRDGVMVEAILFGHGDPALARASGLEPRVVATPADLMRAFAGALRAALRAPYAIDALVAERPVFAVKEGASQVWVIAYGDDTLGAVAVSGPGGRVAADFAANRLAGAGAYRVAYLENPGPGDWRIEVSGGGAGAAYAVIQYADLAPVLLGPRQAMAGVPVLVEGEVRRVGAQGPGVPAAGLAGGRLSAEVGGRRVVLNDSGRDGDTQAGDGRFGARVTFERPGLVPLGLVLESPLAERTATGQVEVAAALRFADPVTLDLGTLGLGDTACRPLMLRPTQHAGTVPIRLEALRRPPAEHRLMVSLPAGALATGGAELAFAPGDAATLCLRTGARAPHSAAQGEPWLALRAAHSDAPLIVRLHWRVEGLGFFARWAWVLVAAAVLAVLALVAAGFILPKRFRPTLGLVFAETRAELDELSPLPIRRQWRGVGAGFYRHARAYLHGNYRLSGTAAGALASLKAEPPWARVLPTGPPLSFETLEGDWEEVPPGGRRARPGDTFRVGDRGPYFRLTGLRR